MNKNLALTAVSRILHGNAKKWYVGERAYFTDWSNFKKKFRKQFIPPRDDDDIFDDLRGRTQGEDEKINDYINNIKVIASHVKRAKQEKK